MNPLKTYQEYSENVTVISNQFIDNYMVEANDAQIKIYLYLVRMICAHRAFTISDIADKFNHTEKDVLRALRYWEKQKLLSLDFESAQTLAGIHLLPFSKSMEQTKSAPTPVVEKTPETAPAASIPSAVVSAASTPERAVILKVNQQAPKISFSADELAAFKDDEETSQIIFITEQYIGKPLSRSDLETLLFIYHTLGFSSDLIDFLIQYCVGRGKKQFSYIEKVAIDWSDSHITNVKQAKSRTNKYDKQVYTIMKSLGKTSDPTDAEVTYIKKWLGEYGFGLDLINKACEKTVLATDRNRFQYANAILTKWKESGFHTLKEIDAAEASHSKSGRTPVKDGGFNDFAQRSYDYDALEKMLLNN